MKVLFVCSGNKGLPTFVEEQADSLKRIGLEISIFQIKGRGIKGYFKNYLQLRKKLKKEKYNLIHAHYGLSGLVSVLQLKIPVIVTFHGSDIYRKDIYLISRIVMKLADFNIFVSKRLAKKANAKKKYAVISCGVDMETFFPLDKDKCREILGWGKKEKIALFSSSFENPVKNSTLAIKACRMAGVKLIELRNYSREQVNILMNAADLLLVTSFRESGPLVVKEAMACGCPVVTTDVGDVREIIRGVQGCYITSFEPQYTAKRIKEAIRLKNRANGREKIKHLDINKVAKKINSIYMKIGNNTKDSERNKLKIRVNSLTKEK
ncbi:MAG: glycosyltransferase family 4 protein [Candidatus Helarchaeota archaeon]